MFPYNFQVGNRTLPLYTDIFPFCCLLFSHSLVSDSLKLHALQHTRLPCPSVSQSLLKLTSIESAMSYLQLNLKHLLDSIFNVRSSTEHILLHINIPLTPLILVGPIFMAALNANEHLSSFPSSVFKYFLQLLCCISMAT